MSDKKNEELKEKKFLIKHQSNEDDIEKRHSKGMMTARERIANLVDTDSFVEQYAFAETISTEFDIKKKSALGDGCIVGHAEIDEKSVFIGVNDGMVMGGSGASTHIRKLVKTIDLAVKKGKPYLQLTESSGGRIHEGLNVFSYAGSVFYSHTMASGKIPQICAIMGRCAGFGVYGPALMDFIFIVDEIGEMFITGPKVIKAVTGEEISFKGLGGAEICSKISGVADFRVKNEKECFVQIKRLLSFFPSNNLEMPPIKKGIDDPDRMTPELENIVPAIINQSYNMLMLIKVIVDDSDFMEVKAEWAKNIITGFARFDGQPVGIVANQPDTLAGTLTIDSSDKSARFVRFCDAFNIPLLFLVDTPGYLPGIKQEHEGIIRHGAKLLHAYCEATVPKITVVVRKCYGGGHSAMAGHKEHGTDMVFALPTAEFAVMGANQAVSLLYRKEIQKSQNPESFIKEKINEYEKLFSNPYRHASTMCIDDVIEPKETRIRIIKALKVIKEEKINRNKTMHTNIPL